MDIYEQIAHGMWVKGYDRDQRQCCVKVKEVCQGYQKARKTNNRFDAEPQICCFYKLHAILGSDPTSTMQTTVDILEMPETETPAVKSKAEERVDALGGSSHAERKVLFDTAPQTRQSHQASTDEPDEREGTSRMEVNGALDDGKFR
ncbi:hypothetical protein UY3_10603 [Chelonia mydas]|uniref:Myb/SANT-like DNA-binding domain-containing protein n=1 Tax=Chelonia mydas TaxID=8469 RepID=M7BVX4_CHEMY|nr:hypothetical protein UY3_10603 [Chelonia mydas]